MKNITVNILSIIALTIIFSFNTASAGEWVKVIEMGESGIAIEFCKSKKPVVGFEMAESGHFIEFPVTIPDKKMDLGDLVIAGDTADKGATRIQSLIDRNG